MKSLIVLVFRYIHYVRGYLWQKDEFNSTCNQTKDKEDEDFHLQISFTYICWIYGLFIFLVLLQAAIMFSKEIVFFFNEHRNGWYSTGSFYLMKIFTELIPIIPVIFIYCYIVNIYEPILPGIYYWIVFYLIIGTLAAQAIGHLIAIITLGEFIALIISIPAIQTMALLVSNMVTPVKRLHYTYQFLANFLPTRFGVEALSLLQYGFNRCRRKQVQKLLYRLRMENDEHKHHSAFLMNTIIMLVFIVIFYRIIALLLLLIKTNRYENRRKRAQNIIIYHKNLKRSNVIIPGLQCHNELIIKKIQI
ncbi:hypothetical protein BLA29_004511 [Euroglyphus maynei]|uniref:ABC-2 type transporter transmembrane domain-containing protein n=1 Tax=Euroglyphus maynei TaxID=6958 RepID=A0A1Y3ANZ1_EURMA|nr:hypothetical protein BLA29_004511 [Euroglyphus maynei]